MGGSFFWKGFFPGYFDADGRAPPRSADKTDSRYAFKRPAVGGAAESGSDCRSFFGFAGVRITDGRRLPARLRDENANTEKLCQNNAL